MSGVGVVLVAGRHMSVVSIGRIVCLAPSERVDLKMRLKVVTSGQVLKISITSQFERSTPRYDNIHLHSPPPQTQTPTQQIPSHCLNIKTPIVKKGEYEYGMKMDIFGSHSRLIISGKSFKEAMVQSKGNQDSRRRDAWNTGNKDKDNGRRSGKQEESKAFGDLMEKGSDTKMSARDKAGLGYGRSMTKRIKNKGIVDSGCSRHMTGNKAHLAEYQDYNGGPIAFGGSKGYITGKDTECLVLSPDFKLPDENKVLHRVPRQNNMYSFNLENIVPSVGLACLIAKDTVDESNKWHRRLGHKGKQHRASAARASSTNTFNTASTPVSTSSPSGGPSFTNLTNTDQDDLEIPDLEDSYDNPNDGIFTNASYDDEGAVTDFINLEAIVNVSPIPTSRMNFIHPSNQILGDPKSARRNNHKDFQHCLFACFLSQIEPKKISEALEDESWVDAMQEELLQFKKQKVWILVDFPYGKKAIGTKWVYRNKKDEIGVVIRNTARFVAQGHRQEKGINYDEVLSVG
ncbi:putative ribonuclease H-like domain-containing protein [Tanacetum coccineum]